MQPAEVVVTCFKFGAKKKAGWYSNRLRVYNMIMLSYSNRARDFLSRYLSGVRCVIPGRHFCFSGTLGGFSSRLWFHTRLRTGTLLKESAPRIFCSYYIPWISSKGFYFVYTTWRLSNVSIFSVWCHHHNMESDMRRWFHRIPYSQVLQGMLRWSQWPLETCGRSDIVPAPHC